MKATYLIIDMATLLFPLAFSFERKIQYYKTWRFLFPSLIITACFFLIWDYVFTVQGVWGFNTSNTLGIQTGNLPLEEILFFFCIPFSSIFIYEALQFYFPKAAIFDRHAKTISIILLTTAIIIAAFNTTKAYTFYNALCIALLLFVQLFFVKGNYMGRFYRFYLVQLIPFFIVNSILTGSFIKDPVVWYNNAENMGIRIGTIPLEDSLYSMSLMLMNIMLFEYLRSRSLNRQTAHAYSH